MPSASLATTRASSEWDEVVFTDTLQNQESRYGLASVGNKVRTAAQAARIVRPARRVAQGEYAERPRPQERSRRLRKPSNAGCRIVDAALALERK
jgi:predicted signal transduction protein with EAL and GGDEF domain